MSQLIASHEEVKPRDWRFKNLREGRRWSPEEIELLLSMSSESTATIAGTLGRTLCAVISKRNKLDLYYRRTNKLGFSRIIARSIEAVTRTFGTDRRQLMNPDNRHRPWPQWRFLVYWLAHRQGASLNSIGKRVNVDHTTVRHGYRAIERRRDAEPELRALADRLLAELMEGGPC